MSIAKRWRIIFIFIIPLVMALSVVIGWSPGRFDVSKAEIEQHIRYLSSDQLKGRKTGTPEIDSAAQYIADFFRSCGLQKLPGNTGYFQEVKLKTSHQPGQIAVQIGKVLFESSEQVILLEGQNTQLSGSVVSVRHGTDEDLEGVDLRDKFVIAAFGDSSNTNAYDYLINLDDKVNRIRRKGASALIEVVSDSTRTWQVLQRLFEGSRYNLDLSETGEGFYHLLVADPSRHLAQHYVDASADGANLHISGYNPQYTTSKNVLGWVPGRDSLKRREYLMITAHYDHIGVGEAKILEDGTRDSIYNGARDNAVGTVALMMAAKAISEVPTARSVIFFATTAEEEGLLGSRWYAQFPVLPLEQMVFNINIDGAGYDDTSVATLVGLGRTNMEATVDEALHELDLESYADPVIDKQFFGRSDNIHFARKGIPSITYSMGFRSFSSDLLRYYHQVIDEADDLDYRYLKQWMEAYVNAIVSVAENPDRPQWKADDPFRQKSMELYGGE